MPLFTRRTFFRWLGGLLAALGGPRSWTGAARRRRAHGQSPTERMPALDATQVQAVAEAVLPSALGAGGIAVAATAFRRWIDGYRPGAELVHGYGTGEIRFAGPSPAPRWQQQLSELDQAAMRAHNAAFPRLTVAQRQALIRAALAPDTPSRLPAPTGAPHVAIALLAHFAQSPDATDLCYERQIGRTRCRPLVSSSREPVPLARGTAGRAP
jgi:hypothetical protein